VTTRQRRVKKAVLYVIARNKRSRPTLQHKLLDGASSITACGQQMELWSRSYQQTPIESVLCKKAPCRE
jgi:hypothetical protein